MKKPEEEITKVVDEYIATCKEEKKMPTKCGLLLALRVYNRDTYNNWKKKSDALKRFEALAEEAWVQTLRANNVAGTIFYLKNAFQYRDRQDIDHTSGGKPIPLLGGESNGKDN